MYEIVDLICVNRVRQHLSMYENAACLHVHAYLSVCLSVCVCLCMSVYVYTRVYIYTRVCIDIYT